MQLVCRHHVTTQCFHQRVQQLTAPAYPVRQSRSFQLHSLTGIDLALTVEREMVGILRNQNMRQQARTSQSARNRPTRCRSLGKPNVSAHGSAFCVADARAVDAAALRSQQKCRGKVPRRNPRLQARPRLVPLVANLPAAVPAVRSAAPAFPICARTASAATDSAAASDARSHSPAKAVAGEWPSVLGVPPKAAPATLLDLTCSDPEVSAPTCTQYA